MKRRADYWLYEPKRVTYMHAERLILPDDEPKTWADRVDLHYRGLKRNREFATECRRWLRRHKCEMQRREKRQQLERAV